MPTDPLTDEERAYLLDHLDLQPFSPVVPNSEHRACVARGLVEEVRPGWYRVRSGMRRALRASLAQGASRPTLGYSF
jgi:hypothetical protein